MEQECEKLYRQWNEQIKQEREKFSQHMNDVLPSR
jgi:hypothetical protein